MFCKQNGEERADKKMILLCFYYNLPKYIFICHWPVPNNLAKKFKAN